MPPGFDSILTREALEFVGALARRFTPRVHQLLEARERRQHEIDGGKLPDFLAETRHIRESDWRVGPIPADLLDRRVEITGPTDRKMVINALNSGAKVFMADFEDSLTPTWDNLIGGQINLRDAINGTIGFRSPEGKQYRLNPQVAVLMMRPRGWHLFEKHIMVDGEQVPGAFVDFGLYAFHNSKSLLAKGTGPYFYLPKMESHLEARLWSDVFTHAETLLGLKRGTFKATVLIETILAAFEMDEILHELKDHIVGLNCGRWDYIFSFIKKFARRPDYVLPDRQQVTMTTHFLRSYSQLLIKTCHRRGAFAMGGMAAQIPIRNDAQANEAALAKVRADKEREAGDGHDGTWVAHPGLVPVAREIFDRHMPGPNQLERLREDVHVTAADLLRVPEGTITQSGLAANVNIGLQYLAAWLAGLGCVPINNLMEDAATAEISRAQLWQWVHHPTTLHGDGRRIIMPLVREVLAGEVERLRAKRGEVPYEVAHLDVAARLLDRLVAEPRFAPFLTLLAYREIHH
jgi:malate synthase